MPGDSAGRPSSRPITPVTRQPDPASTPAASWGPILSTPSTPLASLDSDLDAWTLWWRLNRDSFVSSAFAEFRPATPRRDARTSPPSFEGVSAALLRALDEGGSNDFRSSILLALARIGERDAHGASQIEPLLLADIADPDGSRASIACAALGILGRADSVPTLGRILLDKPKGRALRSRPEVEERTRAFAAYALGLVGRRTSNPDAMRYATHALAQFLDSGRGAAVDARVATVIALGRIDPRTRPRSGDGCACASNDALARRLLELLADPREELLVRAHVPDALARLYPHLSSELGLEVRTALVEGFERRSEHHLVRQGCALALGTVASDEIDGRARTALLSATEEGALDGPSVLALARTCARTAASSADPISPEREALAALMKRLASGNAPKRAWAALALGLFARELEDAGQTPSSAVFEALTIGVAESSSGDLMAAFALAACLGRDPASAASIVPRLGELTGENLGRTALALGICGATDAIEPLRRLLRGTRHQPFVLGDVATALALLGDPSLVAELDALPSECGCRASRLGATLALGRSRDPSAAGPILRILEDRQNPELERSWAALALASLADPDPRPWHSHLSSDLHYRASPPSLMGPEREGILDLP